MCDCVCCFFFKQKTAYEMRISDWSSDVCSSDLTEGLAEHPEQVLGGIIDLLLALAPAQVGMHHVALDRTRPHNGDLDDEVLELARLKARQHGHLRTALDLEHDNGIGRHQHNLDGGDLTRHRSQREPEDVVPLSEH